MTTENTKDYWPLRASCRGQYHLFDSYEDDNGNDTYPYLDRAKAICFTCPVKEQCATAGANEVQGIWGGEAKGV